MSRPIYEPSLQRTDARLGYGQNQLFRRPAPTAAVSGAASWAFGSARITGSAIDYVEPQFDTGTAANFFRTEDGIWSLNGSERLVLAVDNPGLYRVDLAVHDIAANSGVNTVVKILTNLVTHPSVSYWLPSQFDTPVAGSDVIEANFPIWLDAGSEDYPPQGSAGGTYHNAISWLLYCYPAATDPAEFRVRVAYLEDGSFTTEQVDITLSVAKIAEAIYGVTSS